MREILDASERQRLKYATKLACVLGMLGSDHDGEVLTAARMAEGIRQKSGKTWQTILGV